MNGAHVMIVTSDLDEERLSEAYQAEAQSSEMLLPTEKLRALSTNPSIEKEHPSTTNASLVLLVVLIIVVTMYHLLKPIFDQRGNPNPNDVPTSNLEILDQSNSNSPQQPLIPMARIAILSNDDIKAEAVPDGVGDELESSIIIEAHQVEVVWDGVAIPIAEPVDVGVIPDGVFGAVRAEILQDASTTTKH